MDLATKIAAARAVLGTMEAAVDLIQGPGSQKDATGKSADCRPCAAQAEATRRWKESGRALGIKRHGKMVGR